MSKNLELLEAVRVGNLELVKKLLKAGVNVDARNNDGETSLMLASSNGYLEAVEYLTQNGAVK